MIEMYVAPVSPTLDKCIAEFNILFALQRLFLVIVT